MLLPTHPDAVGRPSAAQSSSSQPYVHKDIRDLILDHFSPPSSSIFIQPQAESERTCILATLARVCKDWSPLVLARLYTVIWLSFPSKIAKLVYTLQQNPHLLALVRRIITGTPFWRSLEPPPDIYVPLLPLLNLKSAITHFTLSHFRFAHNFPSKHFSQLGNRTAIKHLEITAVAFHTPTQFFQLVHSFKRITDLTIGGVLFDSDPQDVEEEIERLRTQKQRWGAASLRILAVNGLRGVPGVKILGQGIEQFRISVHIGSSVDHPILDHYLAAMENYLQLKVLRITIQPWVRSISTNETDSDEVWGRIREHVLRILQTVRSTKMETIQIALLPQQQDPGLTEDVQRPEGELQGAAGNPWKLPYRYYTTRNGLLDALFSRELRGILTAPPFLDLSTLRLVVRDFVVDFNRDWWISEVVDRMHGVARIDANVIREEGDAYASLWEVTV